jgi:hypothetical protein
MEYIDLCNARDTFYDNHGYIADDATCIKYLKELEEMSSAEACVREGKAIREKQVGGSHYNKHKIQPLDVIDEYNLNYYEGNIIKYILRYRDKNGVQDLEKAMHYLEMLIIKENNK